MTSDAPDAAFTELLAARDGSTFLSYLLWAGMHDIREARDILNRWVLAYGKEAVDEAGANIMADRGGERYFYAGPGIFYRDIINELQKSSLEGYLRAVIAHGEKVGTAAELDAARARLVARFEEDRILDAAARLRWAWRHGRFAGTADAQEARRWERERSEDPARASDYAQLLEILEDGVGPRMAGFPVEACGMGVLAWPEMGPLASPRAAPSRAAEPDDGLDALLARVEYPAEDRAAGRQGAVTTIGIVDRGGRVVHVLVTDSTTSTPAMNQAARDLLSSARFTPGTRRGEPVCSDVTIEIPFRLSADEMAEAFQSGAPASTTPAPAGYARVHQMTREDLSVRDIAAHVEGIAGAKDGVLYGYTVQAIFRVATDGGFFTTIHEFPNEVPDRQQVQGLILGRDDALFGILEIGARRQVFRVNPDGSDFETLLTFPRGTSHPQVAATANGRLFGIIGVSWGRSVGVFSLNADGSDYRVIHELATQSPREYTRVIRSSRLIVGSDGNLYVLVVGETTPRLLRIAEDGSSADVIHTYEGTGSYGDLIMGSDGLLYGTVSEATDRTNHHIFRIAPDGSGYTVLHRFDESVGFTTLRRVLVEGSDGVLYGVTDRMTERQAVQIRLYRIGRDGSNFELLDAEPHLQSWGPFWSNGALVGIGGSEPGQPLPFIYRYGLAGS